MYTYKSLFKIINCTYIVQLEQLRISEYVYSFKILMDSANYMNYR